VRHAMAGCPQLAPRRTWLCTPTESCAS
jgi:hypothetical protein